jgi:CheY-like chemotaxis protein
MPNILIVDDNVVFVVELEETLSDLGYQVAGVASTGFEAIQMAKEVRPDLVLMDIEMPGEIDGISAARNILAEERIPIIFLTGHVEEELLQRASRVTTDGYIVKPFHDRQLLGAMEVALRKNENHENSPKFKSEKL